MTEFSRRDMLGAAAAGGMAAAATSTETFGQGQPPFGPTPAPLAGAELPSFRFRLGAVAPKTWDGGWAKEATVVDFPVSQAIAGVLMSLVPGGLRELHWHANAAEWAYVIKGQCRVTTINPQGQSQIVDFNAGDVWYFPRGFGHSIQGIGAASRQSGARRARSRAAHPSLPIADAAPRHLLRRHQSPGVATPVSDLDDRYRRAHADQARRAA